jgi:hypothetical protein
MKHTLWLLLIVIAACNQPKENKTLQQLLADGRWVDLSYDFSEKTLYWPNNPAFNWIHNSME